MDPRRRPDWQHRRFIIATIPVDDVSGEQHAGSRAGDAPEPGAAPARPQSLALAVEEPKADLSSVEGATTRTPWPDVVARYRLDARRGHPQVGSVFRSIGGFAGSVDEQVL
jgi:hypothetical protein